MPQSLPPRYYLGELFLESRPSAVCLIDLLGESHPLLRLLEHADPNVADLFSGLCPTGEGFSGSILIEVAQPRPVKV